MVVYGPDGNQATEVAYGIAGYISLDAESVEGQGVPLNGGACRNNHTMVVTSSAGVTAGTVQLQGSLDGVNWFNLGSALTVNGASETFAPVTVTNQPAQYLRASITSAIVGGTVNAVVASA